MSTTPEYDELLPLIQAIHPAGVLIPNMPVAVFIQEAEYLCHWCTDDQQALIRVGLDWELVNTLPARSRACSQAQALWMKDSNSHPKAMRDWKEQSPAAFALRDQMIHSFRFAFRRHENLLTTVDEIAEGNTNSDLVQDLNDLSVLGKDNLDLLTAINFETELLYAAALLAESTANLLAAMNSEHKKGRESMIIRNKAYTYLKQAVDEIRVCGKFAFRHNPERQKGYASEYWHKLYKGKDKGSDPV